MHTCKFGVAVYPFLFGVNYIYIYIYIYIYMAALAAIEILESENMMNHQLLMQLNASGDLANTLKDLGLKTGDRLHVTNALKTISK